MRFVAFGLFLIAVSCNSSGKQEKAIFQKTETHSELTCPNCGYKQTERMPTDQCQLVYTCAKCKKDNYPKETDCCVFCSYGNHKCPSKQ
ncbi:MAG TPA: GDCCVxC domain-containing (seleno)protein [Flavobacteriales bacterium]|nr:GDCCVxC domain-containing (seleno)protein [Flavobacteriales bacterium]